MHSCYAPARPPVAMLAARNSGSMLALAASGRCGRHAGMSASPSISGSMHASSRALIHTMYGALHDLRACMRVM